MEINPTMDLWRRPHCCPFSYHSTCTIPPAPAACSRTQRNSGACQGICGQKWQQAGRKEQELIEERLCPCTASPPARKCAPIIGNMHCFLAWRVCFTLDPNPDHPGTSQLPHSPISSSRHGPPARMWKLASTVRAFLVDQTEAETRRVMRGQRKGRMTKYL
ncbi:hypothetical protein BX600DRAFT_461370 [Xylariales sp. PMI_506]|nr:hypothetical protein BX600DRAFT_461370 [Xylariales sp. PMI_506]